MDPKDPKDPPAPTSEEPLREPPGGKPPVTRPRSRGLALDVAKVAVGAAIGAAVIFFVLRQRRFDPSRLTPDQLASTERYVGLTRCNDKQWDECQFLLEIGDSIDNGAGAQDPRVREARQNADQHLALVDGAALRRKAAQACAAGLWSQCIAYLDKAKEKDPAGDSSPVIQSARAMAAAALATRPDAGAR